MAARLAVMGPKKKKNEEAAGAWRRRSRREHELHNRPRGRLRGQARAGPWATFIKVTEAVTRGGVGWGAGRGGWDETPQQTPFFSCV